MECDRQGPLRSRPIRGLRHSPAGEGGSLTVPTAHGPPHSASGRRLSSRLFIIKPVKNTSQTASELQTDGRCVLFACVGFLSGRQPSQPRHHSPGSHLRLTGAIVTTAHVQPARAKMLRSCHCPVRGRGARSRCGLSLAPCIARRRDYSSSE